MDKEFWNKYYQEHQLKIDKINEDKLDQKLNIDMEQVYQIWRAQDFKEYNKIIDQVEFMEKLYLKYWSNKELRDFINKAGDNLKKIRNLVYDEIYKNFKKDAKRKMRWWGGEI